MEREVTAGAEVEHEFALHAYRAQFVVPASEQAFRASIAASERRAFWVAMLFCGPLYLAFIVSDYLQLGFVPAFWGIVASRGFVCLLALMFALDTARDDQQGGSSVTAVYQRARLFFIAALGLAFVIFPLSGKDYVELYPGLIVMLMVAFFFVPARFMDRLVAGIIAIIGFNIEAAAATSMEIDMRHLPLALLLMLATLVLGALAARRHAVLRRQHYADRVQQQRLNQRLSEEVMSRQHLQQEAMQLAHTDPLTGVANRRHLLAAAEEELDRVRRYGGPLSVMVLDVDHFKEVNDNHGHAIGDTALVIVASTCRDMLRSNDLFGRMGGDEFVMLLPQTDVDGAMVLADRLREAIAIQRFDGGLSIGVTIGVAGCQGEEDTLEAMLRRADRALYDGKESGRGRVVVAVQPA